MRLMNAAGRMSVLTPTGLVDVATASRGLFSPEPQSAIDDWDRLRDWLGTAELPAGTPVALAELQAPVPRPRQVFAIGLNYVDHADEAGFSMPAEPMVFTKFASSLAGPYRDVELPSAKVDYEVELVAVIGKAGSHVPDDRAWEHVLGLMVGQDFSERELQFAGPAPQFSLAKSYRGFAPVGPALVSLDEIADPNDLPIRCVLNGEEVQSARTSEMIFSVPEIIGRLSRIVTLLPGDLIFTGTPSGVGMGRTPERYLRPGDVVESFIDGLGELRQSCVAANATGLLPAAVNESAATA